MRLVVPDYYPAFRCLAGACRHSCCIGWEIDIDEATLALYETMPGDIGVRVRESICREGEAPCFRLGEGERCPHLNREGLCEIILLAGEDALSQICSDHPRFRSFFSDRTEMGLGLCCEAACRLVLGHRAVTRELVLEDDGEREPLTPWEKTLLDLRARLVGIVQDRTEPLAARVERMLTAAGVSPQTRPLSHWADFLRGLERLDPAWDACLDDLRSTPSQDCPAEGTDTPLEQFLVYSLYRHLPDAEDEADVAARVAFAALGYRVLRALAARRALTRGTCTPDDLAEYARLWSSEIEYSPENTAACLAALHP